MITIMKRAETPPFAYVEGMGLRLTPLGREVQKLIIHFSEVEASIRILQYAVMPDHVHILLFVTCPIPEKLGLYIARWKINVNKACGLESVFETGFNDQILRHDRSLKVLVRYLRDNPRRLAVRRALPQYFRRVSELRIGKGVYNAYGNIQLLDNPFKEQVVVHRADSEATRLHNRDLWLYTAANGGVLVSPFISPAEKAIRAEAEALGGRIVLISPEPFGERYKPALHDFQLCEEGRLLIVSCPSDRRELDRRHCLAMNSMATAITTCDFNGNLSLS